MQIQDDKTFRSELDLAIDETARYLAGRTAGKPGHGTVEQLQALHDYVKNIADYARSGKFPSKTERQIASLGWILVDDWDPKDPVGARLLEINYYYIMRIP